MSKLSPKLRHHNKQSKINNLLPSPPQMLPQIYDEKFDEELDNLAQTNPNLTIDQFLEWLQIDQLYIHKFVQSIDRKLPILIDDEVIRMLGFTGAIDKARSHFKESCSHHGIDIGNPKKYNEIQLPGYPRSIKNENMDKKTLKKTNFYLLTPLQFKELFFTLRTEQGKQFRKYYLYLEEAVHLYGKYQSKITENKHKAIELRNAELEKQLNCCQKSLKNVLKLECKNEEIYITSSKKYADQGLWKIGRSNCSKHRLVSMNTSHPVNDAMVIIETFNVYDAKVAEDRIKYVLSSIRDTDNREFYKGIFSEVRDVVAYICDNLSLECGKMNGKIENIVKLDGIAGVDFKYGIQDLSIFDTSIALISKDKQTDQIIINPEEMTTKDIEDVILTILRKKTQFREVKTIEEATNRINKYRMIKREELETLISKADENIIKQIEDFLKQFNNKLRLQKNTKVH